MNSRSKNVARTFVFGVISRVVSILFPFITRTIIIYKLGTDYVGLTSLFTAVLTILNVSELGINSAISFCLYKSVAENDLPAINALMALMKKLYRIIGFIILGVGLVLMPFLDKLITGSHPADINIYWLYLIYLVNAVISYLGFAYKQTLLEANQRGDVNHKITTFVSLGQYAAQIVVLLLFANYYYYALILPIATFFITLVTQWQSRRMYPEIVPGGTVPKDTMRLIGSKVIFLAAHSISSSLTNSVDNIILSTFLGLTILGIYGNYNYVSTAITGILLIAYKAILPSMGNSMYTDTEERRYQFFSMIQLLSTWIVTWCSACMLCLFQPFMILWVGEDNLLGMTAVIMVVLYFYVNSMRLSLSTIYIQAAGLWNKTLPRQIITAVANLVLDILLVQKFGVTGIVFASFITALVLSYPMDVIVTFRDVLHRSALRGICRSGLDILKGILICAATYFICSYVLVAGVARFIIKFCICLVVPNAILFLLAFRTREFALLKEQARVLIRRHRG